VSAALDIHVGTSGYSFADWVGPFYPPGTKSAEFLAYYARQFGCVEVNSTYYRIPQPRVFEQMEKKTPAGFRFVVKLHQSMTHEGSTDAATYASFLAVLEPLKAAGKYHGLLAQFPWAFRRTDGNKAHLERLRGLLPGEPLWVEFRHASWMHPRLPEWLRERSLGYCVVDEPALPGLVPPVTHLTTDTGYVRMHGRNAAMWWGRGGGDRYDYDYSEPELKEWVTRVTALAQQARQTYLFFNNCHAGQAARNAKLMEELLRRQQALA
jgi:uncharacterized protein YecE (DUF72 family)